MAFFKNVNRLKQTLPIFFLAYFIYIGQRPFMQGNSSISRFYHKEFQIILIEEIVTKCKEGIYKTEKVYYNILMLSIEGGCYEI